MECADQLYADTDASQTQPAEYGKTELSLMHFTVCFDLLHFIVKFLMWSRRVDILRYISYSSVFLQCTGTRFWFWKEESIKYGTGLSMIGECQWLM